MKKNFLFIILFYTTSSAISFSYFPLTILKSIPHYFSKKIERNPAQQINDIEKQVKKIEQFLQVNPFEVHKADICLEKLSQDIQVLAKKLKKTSLSTLTPKQIDIIKEQLLAIEKKIGTLREQFFSGINLNSYVSYHDVEQHYQNNFDRPLKAMGISFKKFMKKGGIYGYLNLHKSSNHFTYEQLKRAFLIKKEQVDSQAQTENNNDLTTEQSLCRQIEYLISNPDSKEWYDTFCRGPQAIKEFIADAQVREKRQEDLLQNISTIEQCKEITSEMKLYIRNVKTIVETEKDDFVTVDLIAHHG
jgi:hypothetical protein